MYDAVGGVLLECVQSNEDEVKDFCKTLHALLTGEDRGKEGFAESAELQDSTRLLDAPVQLSTKLKVEGKGHGLWSVCTTPLEYIVQPPGPAEQYLQWSD